MADQRIYPVAVPVMKPVAPAVPVILAIGTFAGSGPRSVAKQLILCLPDGKEIVAVDISLCQVSVNVGASRNGTINQYGTDIDTCATEKGCISYFCFIVTHIAFTAEFHLNIFFLSGFADEFHQFFQLISGQKHFRIIFGAANRDNGKQSPGFYSFAYQVVSDFFEFTKVALTYTGYHIKVEAWSDGSQPNPGLRVRNFYCYSGASCVIVPARPH